MSKRRDQNTSTIAIGRPPTIDTVLSGTAECDEVNRLFGLK
jgi:hypothetical protein